MMQGSSFARRVQLTVVVIVVLIFGLPLAWTFFVGQGNQGPSYPYSAMLADAQAGKVVSISQNGTQLSVSMKGEAQPRIAFVTSSINVYAEACAAMGKASGPDCPIQFEVVGESQSGQWLGLIITSLLPVVLIAAFIYFMMRAQRQKK